LKIRALMTRASLRAISLPQWVKMACFTPSSLHQASCAPTVACPIKSWPRRRTMDRVTVAPSPM
jgi:hypothetical protein